MPPTISPTAEALLAAAHVALEDAGRTIGRSQITWGSPAWELCSDDQLSVYVSPVDLTANRCSVRRDPTYNIQLVRCVPGIADDGTPPSAAALTESAVGLLDDLDVVVDAIVASARDIFGACDTVRYGSVSMLGPEGYAAAWNWPITAP